ncbi:hypothetical protein GGX14DRAFT_384121 [Mycena pura]|uniref:Uncharacterized protein n=1 Tax=Mycena pura TaxID=153505 RepID=A0AAD6YVJ6_9AGAR|nr:hypothetical protein GGX14DRAFT_384121 [Mycena pura]
MARSGILDRFSPDIKFGSACGTRFFFGPLNLGCRPSEGASTFPTSATRRTKGRQRAARARAAAAGGSGRRAAGEAARAAGGRLAAAAAAAAAAAVAATARNGLGVEADYLDLARQRYLWRVRSGNRKRLGLEELEAG